MPFVMSDDGRFFADPGGRVGDVFLAAGAESVIAAGRMIAVQGKPVHLTNESFAYKPSLAQMTRLVARLDTMGVDLSGDGQGVIVIVYERVSADGIGIGDGARYRVVKKDSGIELVRETSAN